MRNHIFTILILTFIVPITLPVWAQKNKVVTASTADLPSQNQKIFFQEAYFNSLIDGNGNAAITFLYGRLNLEKENTKLRDTLCLLYFENNQPYQVITVGESILKANPDNLTILRAVAVANQRTQQLTKALDNYEKLFISQKKMEDLYQMASIQYQLKRFGEAEASLTAILKEPNSKNTKVSLLVAENQMQEVNVQAAALNILGVISLELNKLQDGKLLFEKALESQTDFYLPKQSLEMLEKYVKQLENQSKKDINTAIPPK